MHTRFGSDEITITRACSNSGACYIQDVGQKLEIKSNLGAIRGVRKGGSRQVKSALLRTRSAPQNRDCALPNIWTFLLPDFYCLLDKLLGRWHSSWASRRVSRGLPGFRLFFHLGTIPRPFESIRGYLYNIVHLNAILWLYFIETQWGGSCETFNVGVNVEDNISIVKCVFFTELTEIETQACLIIHELYSLWTLMSWVIPACFTNWRYWYPETKCLAWIEVINWSVVCRIELIRGFDIWFEKLFNVLVSVNCHTVIDLL
jgi:hypothetical protein